MGQNTYFWAKKREMREEMMGEETIYLQNGLKWGIL